MSVRDQLTARQVTEIRLKEIEVAQRKLVAKYQRGEITIDMHNDMLMQLIELKRINQAIFYGNKELGDNKEMQ